MVEIFEEVTHVEDILYAGHTGVVVKLAEAAVSCPEIQPALLEAILHAFHTHTHPQATAPVILALLTYEVYCEGGAVGEASGEESSNPSTLHGALLLQAMLKFQDVKVVVKSVLKQKVKEVVRMACDPHGSHVLTTFMSSSTIPVKKKEKLVTKLKVRE